VDKEDSDDDDPNQAMKAFWPSTSLALELVTARAKMSPDEVWTIIHSIADPALRLICQVAFAEKILNVAFEPTPVIVRKKAVGWARYRYPASTS
jgi:hypothetical protein